MLSSAREEKNKFICIYSSLSFDFENEYFFMVSDENKYGWNVDDDTPKHRLFIRDNASVYLFEKKKKMEKRRFRNGFVFFFMFHVAAFPTIRAVFLWFVRKCELRNYRSYQFLI